ncbi:hypothetical protein [Luteimonas deserti]|uniref:Uncharacterized protein n=1 Tax=Luteimonas deserti TaxID=2752306 RepID=A0A7Z0TSW9_9GAMM|nr:hypothetical protein [Luteimonas deserti]NYZ61206.1 hypothetical protein [Luteimonas deserti]
MTGLPPRRPRGPLLIGAVFVLLGGIFIGALVTTVMLRTTIGSAGDLKARDALRLQTLLDAGDGRGASDRVTERVTAEFAYRFIIASGALDAVTEADTRDELAATARWIRETGALAGRDDAVSRWAVIAAACVDAHAAEPRTAATCVRDRMPHDVPAPERLDR